MVGAALTLLPFRSERVQHSKAMVFHASRRTRIVELVLLPTRHSELSRSLYLRDFCLYNHVQEY